MNETTPGEAIARVKEVEERAAAIVRFAKEEAHKAILDAKLDAKEAAFAAETEARACAKEIAGEAARSIAREIEKISQNAVKEKGELEQKASGTMDKTVRHIVERAIQAYGGREAQ